MPEESVLVEMSGGVDSSVAALLLREMGYRVMGVTMVVTDRGGCCGIGQEVFIEKVSGIAEKMDIELHVVDLKDEFKNQVIDYFIEEYTSGRTPNPCILCNQKLKFQKLPEEVRKRGVSFDFLATGHYAAVEKHDEKYFLRKALDKNKDQSYFLYTLSQDQLKKLILPLGDLNKRKVMRIAGEYFSDVKFYKESQDFLCGEFKHLFKNLSPGPILDVDGNKIGEHNGIPNYTVGQRRGLGISAEKPLYVVKIDADENAIVAGEKKELFSRSFTATHLNWINEKVEKGDRVRAKIRYLHEEAPAEIKMVTGNSVKVEFNQSQRAITPGQSVVFYRGDTVLGGGRIKCTGL